MVVAIFTCVRVFGSGLTEWICLPEHKEAIEESSDVRSLPMLVAIFPE